MEYGIVDERKTVSDGYGFQCGAVMENLIAQLLYAVGNGNGGQCRTTSECVVVDVGHAVTDGKGIQRGTVFKGGIADGADTVADHERFQRGTSHKRLVTDGSQGYGSGLIADRDLRQAGAVLECSVVDCRYVCGNVDFRQALTSVEGVFADGIYGASEGDIRQ